MTRKEQIIAKASKNSEKFYKVNDNYGHCFHGGFIDGAEWAKKYLIERVCNELEIMEGKEVAECYRKIMEE